MKLRYGKKSLSYGFNNLFTRRRRSVSSSKWGHLSLADICGPSLPVGGNPSIPCPERGGERVTHWTCAECPLYGYWGDREIRWCKHEHDEHLAILEKNNQELGEEQKADEQLKQRLHETDRERQEQEQRILGLEEELRRLDDAEIERQQARYQELDEIKWPRYPRPDLMCGFEPGEAGNNGLESDNWPESDQSDPWSDEEDRDEYEDEDREY